MKCFHFLTFNLIFVFFLITLKLPLQFAYLYTVFLLNIYGIFYTLLNSFFFLLSTGAA